MTYDMQESTLKRAEEYGIISLRQRSAEVKLQAQQCRDAGNLGLAEALVRNAQSIDEDIREMELAYRMKHMQEVR